MERIAVLVDGDNIGANLAQKIEQIGKRQGRADVMRVYMNATHRSGWLDQAGFRVMHSGCGKNAADLLLSIDAMELALSQGFERFVIASSDGDFVHLAQRLRERGASVVGVGEAKAPEAYQAACSAFEVIERVSPCADTSSTQAPNSEGVSGFDCDIRKMISAHSVKGQGMPIAVLGQKMRVKHNVLISHLPDKNWRAYLSNRDGLYDLDPAGPNAKVRFRAEAFARKN